MAIAFTRTFGSKDEATSVNADGSSVQVLYRVVDITTIAVATNLIELGYLPAHAIPVGGYFSAVDLDTGTEVLDMDVGIAANGVDAADPDFFTNAGVLSGDAIGSGDGTLVLTNASQIRLFTGPFPVTQLGAKTLVQVITNVAANAGGIGKICVCIYYMTPGKAAA